jgi:hypothetical protein
MDLGDRNYGADYFDERRRHQEMAEKVQEGEGPKPSGEYATKDLKEQSQRNRRQRVG